MGYQYLAVPYSHFPPAQRQVVVAKSFQACLWLMEEEYTPFNPVGYGHFFEGVMKISLTHEAWMNYSRPFLAAASMLIVFATPGWTKSYGVRDEIAYFTKHNRPIRWLIESDGIDPFELKNERPEHIL